MLMTRSSDLIRLFGDLRYIVIDEIHTLMGSDRGNQIICLLARLRDKTGVSPRRIGLSATLGDMDKAAAWLGSGSGRDTRIPAIPPAKVKWKLGMEHFYIASADSAEEPTPEGNKRSETFSLDPGYEYIYDATKGKKAIVVVGGGSMKRFGFLDRAEQYLKEAGMEVQLFEGIEPDPSVETVMKGAKAMMEFEPDWIIAMGGGSPIDAAKAMWIKYEYPDITFEDMCKVFGIPALRKKAHFCAISSTSGTATEVTAFSIITDYEKGIKYPIADFEITPDVAIVDPDLAETMPQKLVAHTGMDAMTHAIEAYVSTANCDFTDPLALHAIKMIQNDLVDSYNGDMAKRDSMHNAQCLAGMAFSNALLGIVHSMAHKTGAAFADYGAHIIHGAANAMYLPKVIAFNAKDETAKKRYGDIADFMGLGGDSLDEKVALLIAYLRKMNDDLKIPHCIKNYGADSYPTEQGFVPEEVFLERLPEIAANAILDACTGSNPRQPSQEEMEKLLKCCYYDTEVDF